jgi:hypothetical protein
VCCFVLCVCSGVVVFSSFLVLCVCVVMGKLPYFKNERWCRAMRHRNLKMLHNPIHNSWSFYLKICKELSYLVPLLLLILYGDVCANIGRISPPHVGSRTNTNMTI